ncbi:hypothetical protein EV697_102223 [Bisgaardia hudsonensis]|uniref:Uncharacterized protein n=1 Tax=Bisgaardia hudsonensis TaxID=109472 RepID=A0A4R2N1A6_9PAST|nr:putative DNA-binding domain-containing protein [Bisgaardia hudsonensis]QLB13092.1 DUF2063 domain-containing protein [Bisgaardia hudsonensis]TCP13342.1 hypothetical protein EV697_102223 [Bisgaardia hudsonensis]
MSLKVIKKPTLAETQKSLVDAVRTKTVSDNYKDKADRLSVYVRLVRNNAFGFIDRCFTEAQKHCTKEEWDDVKEFFVREGKAHSPYFQDIAGEFLDFCKKHQSLNENILHLMDFECTQLLSEVSEEKVPEEFDSNNDTIMQLSGTTYLKDYPVDFISSDFAEFINKQQQVIIWRDSRFDVYYQKIDELDYWLLSYIQEQPSSLNMILKSLEEVITSNDQQYFLLLEKNWFKWINNGVIIPQ